MKKLREWLSLSSREEKVRLAKMADTSIAQLYHLSSPSDYRHASSALAGKIDAASAVLSEENPILPIITRMDVCVACAECNYAKACLNN